MTSKPSTAGSRVGTASQSSPPGPRNDRHLQIGDEIILFSEGSSLLFADGLLKKRAYALDNWNPRHASNGDLNKCVFRILPQLSYKENRLFRAAVEQDVDGDLFFFSALQRNHAPRAGVDSSFIEELKMSAIIEQEANDVECQRLRGKPVIYGSVIQLFNMHCKRFLCVNPKRTCVNEPTSMAVDIDRNMKRECLFRILPKFRIRAEGEPVRVGDAIVLKSLTTEGHLSVARFSMMNEHIGMEVHEAAASSYKHGWTMKLFQPTFSQQPSSQLLPSSSQSSRVIHGGYFIRLYHKEKEAYMMCQSLLSLALSNYDAAGFDEQKVQLLEYKYDPLNPQDSKSSLVVWQIEFANAYTGDAIEWNKPVRLRHASSNLYLAVLKDQEFPLLSGELSYVVDLINRPSGDERNDPTLFQFANVNSESTQLSASAYTRIRHIQTGAWLHAAGSFRLDSRGRSGPGIGGVPLSVQSDFNKYHIVATSNAHLDDYFSLSIVDQDLMDKIRFVKGMTPWLIKTISKPRFKPEGSLRYPFGPRELKTLTNMMVALIYFCTRSTTVDPFKREGSPILLHQTLLRECSIIEAVLKLLQVPMDLEQRRTIRVAYEELRIREGSDRLSVLSAENIVVPPLSVQDSAVDDSQESLQANSLEREEYVTTLSALKAGDEPGLAAIFRHIYRLLKQFLLGSDHENQVHVATAFDTFLNHLDLKVGAADTLMQLIEGNPSIVQSIDQQQILHFVNLLIRDRNPSCVNFLIALCHCDGMSIPSHQEFIAKHILGSEQMNQSGVHEDSPSHLFRTRIASGGGLEVLPPAGFGQPAWIPLVDLFSSQLKRPRNKSAGFDGSGPLRRRFGGSGSGSFSKKMTPGSPLANNEATAEIAEYFAALIKLYHALCLGHNATVVSWMVDTWKVISLRKCEVVLYDENLPPALRAQFCDLLTVLFVDKFPISPSIADFIFPVNTIENRPSLRYILEDAALEDGKLEVERLSAVTGWLSQFLSQQTQHLQEDKEQNELVLSSLKLLKQLVAFGFVQEENDIISLFLNLTEILDGTTDLRDMEMKEAWSQLDRRELARDPWFTVDRFEMNEINSPIINAKIEICAIMENLLRLRLEMRVYMFLHHWYKFFKQDGFKAKKGSLSLTAEDSSLGFKDAQTLFKSIMEDTAYFKLNDRLSPICLDLLQYESPRLKKRSIRMLHRLHSSVEEILQLLRISLLINDNTYQTSYDWMKTQISVFIEYGVGTPAAVDYFDGTIIGGISESSAAIMQKVLQDFGHLCVAGSSTTGDTVEDEVVCAPGSDSPHSDRMRQWCLRNLGVYGWILALIKNRVTHSLAMANKRIAARSSSAARGRRSLSRDSVHSAGSQNDLAEHSDTHSRTTSPDVGQFSTGPAVQSELLLAIFQFIFYYANGNKEHQSTVFEDFDLLLEATHPSRSGASLMVSASCVSYLGRIFSQSVSLCLRITEDHIRRVLQLSGGVRGEYFELLRCIIKPEGKIIKKNQQAVMKLLLEKKRLYANMDDLLSRFAVITVKNDDDGEDDEEESLEKRKLSATAKKLRVATSRKNSTLPSSITPKKASEDQSASLDYYAELLKTIALCCEEKNYILQSMGQTILSIDQILNILKVDICPRSLKRSLIKFLVFVHIATSDDDDAQNKARNQLEKDKRVWNELKQISHLVRTAAESSSTTETTTIDSVAYFVFEPGLLLVLNFFKVCCNSSHLEEEWEFVEIAEELVDNLVCLAKSIKGMTPTDRRYRHRVLLCIDSLKFAGFYGKDADGDELKLADSLREVEYLDSGMNTPVNASPHISTTQLLVSATDCLIEGNDDGLNLALQEMVRLLSEDKGLKSLQMDEFNELARKFDLQTEKQLSQFERRLVNGPTESLIKYLDESVGSSTDMSNQYKTSRRSRKSNRKPDNSSLTEVLLGAQKDEVYDVKTLRILERLVVHEIMALETVDRKTFPEKWARREKKKIMVQNLLNQLGCSLMAERLLTSDRPGVIAASLRLLIVLLDGGNKNVQETLESYWLGTREERFFYCMHQRIKQAVSDLREAKLLSLAEARQDAQNLRRGSIPVHRGLHLKQPRIAAILSRQGSETSLGSGSNIERVKKQASTIADDELGLGSSLALSGKSSATLALTTADDDPSIAGSGGVEDGEYGVIRSIMRLLQLLVEGHNYRIQEYMRVQPDNIKTFDIVKYVVDYLHAVLPLASDQVMPLIIQVFDTIIDLAQGCAKNQVTIFSAKVVTPVNFILTEPFIGCKQEYVNELKGHAVLALLSLLEDDFDGETQLIFRDMAATLDISSAVANLNSLFAEYNATKNVTKQANSDHSKNDDMPDADEDAVLDTGFLYSMLLYTLLPYMNEEQRQICERSQAFAWFKSKTGRIEILRELQSTGELRLFSVLFPIPEICAHIRKDTKSRFLWMRKRDTPQDKIEDFINQSGDIIYEIKNQARVAGNRELRLLAEGYAWWWRGAYVLTLFLNIGNMLCMVGNVENTANEEIYEAEVLSKCSAAFDYGRLFLGLLQIVLWSLSTAEFMIIQLPLLVNRRRIREQIEEQDRARKRKEQAGWVDPGDNSNEEQMEESALDLQSRQLTWRDLVSGFFKEEKALYHAAMLILAVLGLRFPPLYAIHLLDFLYRDEVLQGVISSVTLNWSSLSKTVVLGVIIIYVYSMIGFVYFRQSFNGEEGLYCDSLLQCFITVLSYGLRAGGGIGELLTVPVPDGESYAARIVLDLSFFLVVIVFLLNVIFGIIFDTFGQLREERKDISDDLKNACYVCSISASEFQREGKGFDYHVKYEHNIWHYLFFLVHLELKDNTEYTSHESYVHELLSRKDLSFFPISRAMSLKDREEGDDYSERLRKIEEKIAMVASTTLATKKEFTESLKTLHLKLNAAEAEQGNKIVGQSQQLAPQGGQNSPLAAAMLAAVSGIRLKQGHRGSISAKFNQALSTPAEQSEVRMSQSSSGSIQRSKEALNDK